MKKTLFSLVILATLLLSACGASASSRPREIGTLESVPTDYSGKTNPLGTDASTDGSTIFKTNCETCHGPHGHGDGPIGEALDPNLRTSPRFRLSPPMIICSGAFPRANPAHPCRRGKISWMKSRSGS